MALVNEGAGGFVNYTGQDVQEILLRPFFEEASIEQQGFRLITEGVSTKLRSTYFGNMERVTRAYADGFQGGTTSVKSQNEMTMVELKSEIQMSKQDYDNLVHAEALAAARQRGDGNNILGTDVAAAEAFIWSRAVAQDVSVLAWVADTTKTVPTGGDFTDRDGTAYVATDDDVRYNMMDGLLKQIVADSSATPTENQIKTLASDIPDTLVADTAADTLDSIITAAPEVLRDMIDRGVARIILTQGMIDNLETTFRGLGTELAHQEIRLGNGMTFRQSMYRGIPIVRAPFSADLNSGRWAAATDKHYAILCDPNNFQVGLNAYDGQAALWYNPDENKNRGRVQYKQAQIYGTPEAICFAKG